MQLQRRSSRRTSPCLLILGLQLSPSPQPLDFPDPLNVDPRRPADRYCHVGIGFHECLGLRLSEETIAEILKVVFQLKSLHRADGGAGRLVGSANAADGNEVLLYMDEAGETACWPSSLTLVVSHSSCKYPCDKLTFGLLYIVQSLMSRPRAFLLAEAVSTIYRSRYSVVYAEAFAAIHSHRRDTTSPCLLNPEPQSSIAYPSRWETCWAAS